MFFCNCLELISHLYSSIISSIKWRQDNLPDGVVSIQNAFDGIAPITVKYRRSHGLMF